jgi:hypothetical protein
MSPGDTEDDPIRVLVERLARPHASGGMVVERAAILAEGGDCAAVVTWITDHAGQPEVASGSSKGGGLHGSRLGDPISRQNRPPARYVLPPGALGVRQ